MDLNLVKAGTVDFSWISKGVQDGRDYAMKQAEMDQQRELTMARIKENDTAKDTLSFQKLNLLTGQIKDYTEALPGPVKKAKKQQLEAAAELLGVKLSPTAMAMFEDPNYTPYVSEFLEQLKALKPEEQLAAYPQIVATLGKENADQVMKAATEQLKAQRETDEAARKQAKDEQDAAMEAEGMGIKREGLQIEREGLKLKKEDLARQKAKDEAANAVALIRAGATDKQADAALKRADTGAMSAEIKAELDKLNVIQRDRKLTLEEIKQEGNLKLAEAKLDELIRSNQAKEGQGQQKIGIQQQQADASTLNAQTNVKKADVQADLGQQRVDVSKGQLGVQQQNAATAAGRAATDKAYKAAQVDMGLAKITTANERLKLDQMKADTSAKLGARALELKAKTAAQGGTLKDNLKYLKDLRDKTQPIQKNYADLNSTLNRFNALLSQKSGIADLAAIQQFLKLVGDSRVTVSELNSIGSAGSALDRLQIFGQKLASGEKLTPSMRSEMREAVQAVVGASGSAERAALEPYYNSAIEYGLDGPLQRGTIINTKNLQKYFKGAKDAPSDRDRPADVPGGNVSARLVKSTNAPATIPIPDATKAVMRKMRTAGKSPEAIKAAVKQTKMGGSISDAELDAFLGIKKGK